MTILSLFIFYRLVFFILNYRILLNKFDYFFFTKKKILFIAYTNGDKFFVSGSMYIYSYSKNNLGRIRIRIRHQKCHGYQSMA